MTIQEQIDRAKRAELITAEQLALLAQYSKYTIWRKAKRGEIPGMVRYGRCIRFYRVHAFAWIKHTKNARNLVNAE